MKKIIIVICTLLISCIFLLIYNIYKTQLPNIDYKKIISSVKKYDKDCKKIGLRIYKDDIESIDMYSDNWICVYKVYNLKNNINAVKIKEQLNNDKYWSKTPFYEYILHYFYDTIPTKKIDIDTEDLYYYYRKNKSALFDAKNMKLYYLDYMALTTFEDKETLIGVDTNNYNKIEVHSIVDGWQGDGENYFVYYFDEKVGNSNIEKIKESNNWSNEKLDNRALYHFKYNEEVKNIENGYYYYKKICRTSDSYKKENFTDEEATGEEIGVYDIDNNIFYYIWWSV